MLENFRTNVLKGTALPVIVVIIVKSFAFSTVGIFYILHFLLSPFFHTSHFLHSIFSTLHIFYTPHSALRVFHLTQSQTVAGLLNSSYFCFPRSKSVEGICKLVAGYSEVAPF